jgi:hypothetical protein
MTTTVVIEQQFCGPPASANGGYACAMAAAAIDGPAEVTLRVPPPLGRPLTVELVDDVVSLLDGDVLVAQARPTTVEVDVPGPVPFAEAQRAGEAYPWRDDGHPYPTCFVCGPDREPGDGLCIFPGPVAGRELYAAPWTPESWLADDAGHVRDAFVWGALDCPGGIVTGLFDDVGLILLGRLAADLRAPVVAGRPHVVLGWPIARDGRKLHTGTAVLTADGALCAVGRATWIEVPTPA